MRKPCARADLPSVLVVNQTNPVQGDLLQFDTSGNPVGTGTLVPNGSGGLFAPSAVAVGPGGNLFVADSFTSSVLEYSAQGTFLQTFIQGGTGGLSDPTGLAFGPDGNLYVSSSGTSSVLEFGITNGSFNGVVSTLGYLPFAGGLSNRGGLTFGPDGNLYVTSQGNGEILEYNFLTRSYTTFVSSGLGGLSNPTGLAFGPDGNLYVASQGNSTPGSGSIIEYTGGNSFAPETYGAAVVSGLSSPTSLAFTPDGNLLVANGNSAGDGGILSYTPGYAGTPASYRTDLVPTGQDGLATPLDLVVTEGPAVATPEPSTFFLPLIALGFVGLGRRLLGSSNR